MGILKMEILQIINFTQPGTGSWLVQFISWLVGICGSVALGIVLFTVVLKLITLPFDYFSRASMRKNSLKMEEMRPELEKLQKQCADNKQLYNQKMMALYKKNGYSMWGACLPTILTLVIFIVAINAFTDYSKIQNKTYFYNMSNSYNDVIYSGLDNDLYGGYIYRTEDGKLVVNCEDIYNADLNKDGKLNEEDDFNNNVFDIFYTRELSGAECRFTLHTTNSYVTYIATYQIKDGKAIGKTERFAGREEGLMIESNPLAFWQNNELKVIVNGEAKTYAEAITMTDVTGAPVWTADKFVLDICQQMSANTYRAEKQDFFWVKNIWATDSTTARAIESDWETFKKTHGYDGADIKEGYQSLIAKLDVEKNEPNGYFILIALTALSSLVLQLVTTKSSKAQMELQTVDGQGMQQQKMMQWMMPIMMAVFAFMYTAAFSIYIIVNSLLSLFITFGINAIVDANFKKQNMKKTEEVHGRVFVPKQEEKKEKAKKESKDKKKNKDDKFAHENGGDFLTGKAKKNK